MSDPRENYLQKIHSNMNTTNELIERATFETTKEKIVSKKRLIVGEHSEVYDITLESGKEIILKISHYGKQFIEAEVWALKKCVQAGVLAPRFIAQQQYDSISFLFETKLKGATLENITPAKRRELAKKLGRILTKLHSISTDGFAGSTTMAKEITPLLKNLCQRI